MSKPKHLFEIDNKTVAHANDGGSIIIQQGNRRQGNRINDSFIFLDRDDAMELRDALETWLMDSIPRAPKESAL